MKKWSAWLPPLAWMGLIFYMSAMPGDVSGAQSGALLEWLVSAAARIFPGIASAPSDVLHLLLRKGAHMAAYAVLALLDFRALQRNGAKRAALYALLLAGAYACLDEYHQSFVAGRGPSPMDVMIDTAGAALALCAWRVYAACRRRMQTVSEEKGLE